MTFRFLNEKLVLEFVHYSGMMVRVFTDGPGDGFQSQVKSYQKIKKWYLIPPFLTLSIIRYDSRISGAIQRKV